MPETAMATPIDTWVTALASLPRRFCRRRGWGRHSGDTGRKAKGYGTCPRRCTHSTRDARRDIIEYSNGLECVRSQAQEDRG
jgi:hypothetical protein